jgi:hypothetical protein
MLDYRSRLVLSRKRKLQELYAVSRHIGRSKSFPNIDVVARWGTRDDLASGSGVPLEDLERKFLEDNDLEKYAPPVGTTYGELRTDDVRGTEGSCSAKLRCRHIPFRIMALHRNLVGRHRPRLLHGTPRQSLRNLPRSLRASPLSHRASYSPLSDCDCGLRLLPPARLHR